MHSGILSENPFSPFLYVSIQRNFNVFRKADAFTRPSSPPQYPDEIKRSYQEEQTVVVCLIS